VRKHKVYRVGGKRTAKRLQPNEDYSRELEHGPASDQTEPPLEALNEVCFGIFGAVARMIERRLAWESKMVFQLAIC
jgi:hypothetical protein